MSFSYLWLASHSLERPSRDLTSPSKVGYSVGSPRQPPRVAVSDQVDSRPGDCHGIAPGNHRSFSLPSRPELLLSALPLQSCDGPLLPRLRLDALFARASARRRASGLGLQRHAGV